MPPLIQPIFADYMHAYCGAALAAGDVLATDCVVTGGTQEGWKTDGDI